MRGGAAAWGACSAPHPRPPPPLPPCPVCAVNVPPHAPSIPCRCSAAQTWRRCPSRRAWMPLPPRATRAGLFMRSVIMRGGRKALTGRAAVVLGQPGACVLRCQEPAGDETRWLGRSRAIRWRERQAHARCCCQWGVERRAVKRRSIGGPRSRRCLHNTPKCCLLMSYY